jgi:hypothetical protein
MQAELDAEAGPGRLPIHLLGVNAVGQEAGNPGINTIGSCPWLQDQSSQGVWGRWRPLYRDVFVLDAQNRRITAYNLTSHDLGDPANYAYLKSVLVQAATIAP